MEHQHIKFYDNSLQTLAPIRLGGTSIVGGLLNIDSTRIDSSHDTKSFLDKQVAIVEYLQKLPGDVRATAVDFHRGLI